MSTKILNGPIELFDLSCDLAEKIDEADQHPQLVRKARTIFADAHQPSQHWRFAAKKQ